MKAIKDFDMFRSELKEAMANLCKKYDCDVELGNIRYDDTCTNLTVSFRANGENGESAEQVQFVKLCRNYGFEPTDYNRIFNIQGKNLRLVGFNTKARKNFCVLSSGDKHFVCAPEALKRSV